MRVYIERTDEEKKIEFNGKAVDLLKKLKINPVTVVLIRNGKIITKQEILKNEDEIEILSVISGG